MVRVRGSSWVMYYFYGSPHKDTSASVCVCVRAWKWPEQNWHLYESYGPSEWKDGKLASVKAREWREKVRTTPHCYCSVPKIENVFPNMKTSYRNCSNRTSFASIILSSALLKTSNLWEKNPECLKTGFIMSNNPLCLSLLFRYL